MGWETVGHDWAIALLSRRLAAGRVAHAYLLTGPPRIGKTHLARRLAQAVNCEGSSPPCGQCQSCRRIDQGTHPDVRLVQVEQGATTLKIEQIREIQHEAVLAPYSGRYRVFILTQMDLASLEAANSLLKTLEEPPRHVILILTAASVEALPPTVVSRCQRLDLRRVALSEIESTLRSMGTTPEQARLIAHLSSGQVGWALEVSKNLALLDSRGQALDEMVGLLDAGRVQRLALAGQVSKDDQACRHTLELWTSWWRDLLLVSAGASGAGATEYLVNVDRVDELTALARRCDLGRVYEVLRLLSDTADHLAANVNARLAMERLMLKLPHLGSRAV